MNQRTRDRVASSNHGHSTWTARGNTYPWRGALRELGFRWEPQSRTWYRNVDASRMPSFRQAVVDIHDNSNGSVRFTVSG